MKLIITGSEEAMNLHKAYKELEQKGHTPFCLFDAKAHDEEYLERCVKMLVAAKYDGIFLLPDWQKDKSAQHLLAICCSYNKVVIPANNTMIPPQITFQTYKTEHHAL